MRKRIFSFFLAFCMAFSLIPAALAANAAADSETETPKMEISGRERTDTGLKFQVSLTGFASGDSLFAVTLQESGKMKALVPVVPENGFAALSLDNVADGDAVKVIWTDAAQAVRTYKQFRRPEAAAEFGGESADASAFSENVLKLIARPQYLSAAAEKELAETEKKAETDPYAYKRLIVSAEGELPDLSAYGKPTVYTNPSSGYSILQFGAEADAKACEAYLASLPTVQYAEPDALFKSGPKDSTGFLGADGAEFKSWGVTKIKADALAAYLQQRSGLGPVVVAVADTGAELDHPFLADRLTRGFDFIDNDDTPDDQHSHGTHVSGTIVDCTPGLDIRIMPVRVLGASGGGTATGIAMGIQYAADNGANVINLSLGGGHSNYMDDAILYAISKGVTVVVAAGNESDDVMGHCPAHIEQAITVAATDSDNSRAWFSNYGAAVDVAAPGVGINSSVPNKGYAQKSGTSMATPHVAAAAAMLKYGNPDMTPEEIQQALKDAATDLGASGWDGEYGYGLINLEPFAKPTTKYSLTYQTTEGGEVSGPDSAAAGQTVKLTISPQEGYALESLRVTDKDGAEVPVRGDAFSMPDSDVTVAATFAPKNPDPGTYKIDCKVSGNGAIDCPSEANVGDEITLTALPAPGSNATLKELFIDGASMAVEGAWTFTFTMPAHDVTIEAVFEESDEPMPHTYELFDSGLVWDEAKAYCEKLGGHLMTVTSADEQAILNALLEKEGGRNSYWLGGYETDDGNYAWVTGEAFSYANWANGQPDKRHGTEDRLMAYRNLNPYASCSLGDWNDLDRDGTCQDEDFFGLENFGFICEWDGETPVNPVDPNPVTEGVFAVLYEDGELAFQNDNKARQDKPILGVYPVDGQAVKGELAIADDDGDVTREFGVAYAEWYGHADIITKVTILDKIQPTSTALWFHGCKNLETITGLEYLDTGAVTNMSHMFSQCALLPEPDLSGFDTSNVTNMSHMFYGCKNFVNLDLTGFDTSNVTDMGAMFSGCSDLRRVYVSDRFVTDAVTNSTKMFGKCEAIEGTYGTTFQPERTDKEYARLDAPAVPGYFTDPNVISGKAHVYLYGDGEMVFQIREGADAGRTLAKEYEIDVAGNGISSDYALWYDERDDIRTVTFADPIRPYAVSQWFYGCRNLTEIRNMENLDTGAVTNMSHMFAGCSALASLDLGALNTANVASMKAMFENCAALTELDFSGFDAANVTDMSSMFKGCSGLTSLDLDGLNVSNVTDMSNMFRNCASLTTINAAPGAFPTDAVTDSANMFTGCEALVGGLGTAYDAAHVDKEYARIDFGDREPGYFTDPNMLLLTFDPNDSGKDPADGFMEGQLFSRGVADTLFPNGYSREGYGFTGWNAAPDGSGEFYEDEAVIVLTENLTLYAQWERNSMENVYAILYSDGELVFQWDETPEPGRNVAKTYVADRAGYSDNRAGQDNFRAWHNEAAQIVTVTFAKRIQPDDTAQWFQDCRNLTEIRGLENLDTSLVTDMSNMFAGCESLTELPLSSFDASNVKSMEFMFEGCGSLEKVDLSSFDTANVSLMESMFSGCGSLTTIYASGRFTTDALTDGGEDMFMDCSNLVGGSGTEFDKGFTDSSYARIDGGESNPGYFTAA